jgi:outer membrane protein assembly factor BamE
MSKLSSLGRTILALFLVATALAGCSLYRPDLRQGDFITQTDLDRLKPEMTKYQVQEVMGTPALTPVFNLEQWNYTYAFVDGQHRDQPLKFKTISLYFKNDKLQSYESRTWHPANLPEYRKR